MLTVTTVAQVLQLFEFLMSSAIALFVIIDPFSVIPIYLSLTESHTVKEKRSIRLKATLIGGSILVLFAISGMGIFNLFGITLHAFQIAGGLLLLILGFEQLGANRKSVKEDEEQELMQKDDISVFPLATPLLAGPGAISTVILYAGKAHDVMSSTVLIIAIILTMIATYLILATGPLLLRMLGKTGLNLLTRLMAIILTAIAIQFVLNGIEGFWTVLSSH
jgi:multiple antibiotic resistance protein